MSDANDSKGQGPNQDYEIGYGRPPKDTQCPPGQSGNPKGRKRRPKSVQAQVQKVLSKKVTIKEGGKTRSVSLQEVILRNLANNAAKGDLKAVAFVFHLLKSPEYADTDAIDQNSLSAEDQAMFDDMVKQILGYNGSDRSTLSDITADESAVPEAIAEPDENLPLPRDPFAGSSGDE